MHHQRRSSNTCVIVCTGKDCRDNGAKKVFSRLEDMLQERGLEGRVHLCKGGCMGACRRGPNVLVYPGGDWYGDVRPRDVGAILDSLAG